MARPDAGGLMIRAPERSSELPYMPRMDGLRAICVMLVLTEHFFRGVGQGGIGVAIFFVISGYLITSILVTYSDQLPLWDAARRFYWRRALRLFPAFYLCIALAALLDLGGMRDNWWVNALYLMNFKVAADGAWNGSSHFWTLCVEEQFYLVWFFVVALTPQKYFLHVVLAGLITAPLYRAAMYLEGFTSFTSLLLPGVMDSLATGALICCVLDTRVYAKFLQARTPLLFASFAIIVISHWNTGAFARIFLRCDINVFALCLVSAVREQQKDWKFDWLANRFLRHIGKISYGIYVYHGFMSPLFRQTGWEWATVHYRLGPDFLRFIVLATAAIAVAEVSWRFVEKPIMRLKDFSRARLVRV
jgi:peptidoglycan/LPS O-acetylase OafA/YrhL